MRLGAGADRIHAAGGEVIAISTDDEGRQAGMFERWPTPHVRYVADPGGEQFLRPLGLFDPEERGGIALPATIVLDAAGAPVYEYVGRDFADRTTDEAMFAALDGLGLAAIDPPEGGPADDGERPTSGFFRPEHLWAYFRGNRMASIAIAGRSDDRGFRAIAREHRLMCEATLEAWERVGG